MTLPPLRAILDGDPPHLCEAIQHVSPAPPMKARRHIIRTLVTLALMGAVVHLLLPRLANLDATLHVLGSLRPWALAGSVVAQALSYCASGVTLAWIVRLTGDRLSVGRGIAVMLASGTVGLVAAGALGTAGAAYRWVRDAGVRKEGALLAAWLPTLLNAVAVAAAASLGMLQLAVLGRLTRAEVWAFAASLLVLAVIAAVLIWSVRHPGQFRRFPWGRRRARASSEPGEEASAAAAWRALRERHGLARTPVGEMFAVAFDVLSLYLLFLAAGHTLGVGLLLAGYGLPLLAGKLTVVPGGLGVVEGGMVAMYHALGVPAPTAVTVVLAYRVVSFWLPNLLGLTLIPWFRPRGARQIDRSSQFRTGDNDKESRGGTGENR